jgi:hypothetical protein
MEKGYVTAVLGQPVERPAAPLSSALDRPLLLQHRRQKTMPDENRSGATWAEPHSASRALNFVAIRNGP